MSEIESKRFVRRPFYVDAIQVNGENLYEVAKWCQGEVRSTKSVKEGVRKFIFVRVFQPRNERQTMAFPGDWIVYAGTGYKIYTPNAFNNTFLPVEEEKDDEGRTQTVTLHPSRFRPQFSGENPKNRKQAG
jgi:hypothetical protein